MDAEQEEKAEEQAIMRQMYSKWQSGGEGPSGAESD
jgi:hypothetical protein